jgi:hypothetical protein
MPLVLVQNPVIVNAGYAWKDIEGQQYHFPNQYKNRCTPGTPFVYYRGTRRLERKRAVPEYFGSGVIGSVWRDESIPMTSPKKDWAWYCEILDYLPFQSPVPAKIDGSFIETIARNHWSVGIRPLPQESFDRILRLADVTLPEHQSIVVPELQSITVEEADAPLLVPHAAGLKSGSDGPSARYSRTAAAVGRRAEEIAHRFLGDHSTTIGVKNLRWVAREGLTPGWDIQYTDLTGQAVAVEVKGATGARFASIDLTAGEWKAAQTLGDRYWLYLVADCLSANPRIQRIQNPAKVVADGGAQLIPIAYRLAILRNL